MMVATVGQNFVNPSVYLRPSAQPASRSPAKNRVIQAVFCMSSLSFGPGNVIPCPPAPPGVDSSLTTDCSPGESYRPSGSVTFNMEEYPPGAPEEV
jgi:hypothetical protein